MAPLPRSRHLPGEAAGRTRVQGSAPSHPRLRLPPLHRSAPPPAPSAHSAPPRLRPPRPGQPNHPLPPRPEAVFPVAAARPSPAQPNPKARLQVWPLRENGAAGRPGPLLHRWGVPQRREARGGLPPPRTRTWVVGLWVAGPAPPFFPSRPPPLWRTAGGGTLLEGLNLGSARIAGPRPKDKSSTEQSPAGLTCPVAAGPGRPAPPKGPALYDCALGPERRWRW